MNPMKRMCKQQIAQQVTAKDFFSHTQAVNGMLTSNLLTPLGFLQSNWLFSYIKKLNKTKTGTSYLFRAIQLQKVA